MFPNLPRAFAAIAVCSLGLLSTTRAVDFDWNGSVDNAWLTPGNWTPAGPPSGGDGNFARYYAGTTRGATITADVPTIQDILTGNNGTPGLRTITQSAGTAILNGWLRMGVDPDGAGAITGAGDGGAYNLSGGTLSAGSYRIAEVGGSTATVNVSGGTFLQRDVADTANGDSWSRIGQDGVATVNVSGTGTVSLDSRVLIGGGAGSAGTLINQTGGVFEVRRGELTIGDAGPDANYTISAGTLRTLSTINDDDQGGNITVGQWDNSNAKLNISGTAVVRASRDVNIADGRIEAPNAGTVTQTGGTFTYGRGFEMARTTTGTAIYTLSGGTLMQDTVDPENADNWNHIGNQGNATFNLSGSGVASFNGRTHLGLGAGGNGTVNQTGGSFEVRNHELILGDTGTGTYNISAGTLKTIGGRPIAVGHWNNSVGNLNVSGTGVVESGGDLFVGNGDTTAGVTNVARGTVTQTGGTVRVGVGGGGNLVIGNDVEAVGVYNLNGGTLDLTGGNIVDGAGTSTFNFNNGRLEGLGNFNFANISQTDGVLAVGPTTGTGVSTISGNYSLLLDGDLELSIINTTAFDSLNVNGTVTLLGGLRIVQDTPGLPLNTQFVLVQNDGTDPINGRFTTLAEGGVFVTPAGNAFSVSYQGGTDNNDVTVRVVPEPTIGMLMVASVGLAGLLRRRRA